MGTESERRLDGERRGDRPVLTSHPAPASELPKAPAGSVADAAQEVFARAAEHGDEHVVKFADTALDVAATTGSTGALVAAARACELIGPVL